MTHIVDAARIERHALRAWARVENGRVWYPAADDLVSGASGSSEGVSEGVDGGGRAD